MQPDDPGHKRNKGFYENRQCRMDGLRFINQNGGMRRPRILLRRVRPAGLLERGQFCVLFRAGKQNLASGKHADMAEMHRHRREFRSGFPGDLSGFFLLLRGKVDRLIW